MPQFLKENIYSPKNMTQNRVLMLNDRINNLKIGHKAQAERRLDSLQKQVIELQGQLQKINENFNNSHFQLKHILSKISKQLSFDFNETDRQLREQVSITEQYTLNALSRHTQQRKLSDARIIRFIQQKCVIIRDLVQRENRQRTQAIGEIQTSLERDLAQIRQRMESESRESEERLQDIHRQFLQEYQKMREQFIQQCDKGNENETKFNNMLKDIVKKVKQELGEGKRQREEMEESILVLIQRICDKAMEQTASR